MSGGHLQNARVCPEVGSRPPPPARNMPSIEGVRQGRKLGISRRSRGKHLSLRIIASSRTHRIVLRQPEGMPRGIVAYERLLRPFASGSTITTANDMIERSEMRRQHGATLPSPSASATGSSEGNGGERKGPAGLSWKCAGESRVRLIARSNTSNLL